mmetsp:Transcript_30387/g.87048  ORF Transcript_30387/g.87048 Transcript_30387/m.87048 type:complete len:674 (-) Transcript_30387:83-2104(-)
MRLTLTRLPCGSVSARGAWPPSMELQTWCAGLLTQKSMSSPSRSSARASSSSVGPKVMKTCFFSALDVDGDRHVGPQNMRWLDLEKRRLHRKTEAKKKSEKETVRRLGRQKKAKILVQEFRSFLLQRYGDYLRAWRVGLNPSGSMNLRKTQFLKSCAKLGWQAASHLIWESLDKDDSGSISLDEIDLKTVELLASFHYFIMEKFGSAAAAFRGIDEANTRQVRLPDFVRALQRHGFTRSPRQLFNGIDRDGSKVVTEDEFLFLDEWRPQPYLLATPNAQAMNELKALLLDRHGNYLKAWRHLMDQDSTNRCNWGEFQAACVTLRFSGDTAGAWRALDADLSGYITLQEIDADSCHSLSSFRLWADNEFGGVKYAFSVFDNDNSNQVTKHEFCRSCRIFGYVGDAHRLFHALDVDREGTLSLDEVAFLDDWDMELEEPRVSESEQPQPPDQKKRASTLGRRMSQHLLQTPVQPQFPTARLLHQSQTPQQPQTLRGQEHQGPRNSLVASTEFPLEDSCSSPLRSGPSVDMDHSIPPSMRLLERPPRRPVRRRKPGGSWLGGRPLPPLASLEDSTDIGVQAEHLTEFASAFAAASCPEPGLGAVLGIASERAGQPQDAVVRVPSVRSPARGSRVAMERALATYGMAEVSLSARGRSALLASSKRMATEAPLFLTAW